ncbi:hypothetical protein Raf01_41250 [Rugosimonospora africana]|uniref:Uncharacterized protein n=1 Tax=Rugosimonospora africana TaxID=556532 RepID=A0A8J3QUH1_9ACTN|nr:hypothetical protein Raf01_41250 [Rugosimonospora africana]
MDAKAIGGGRSAPEERRGQSHQPDGKDLGDHRYQIWTVVSAAGVQAGVGRDRDDQQAERLRAAPQRAVTAGRVNAVRARTGRQWRDDDDQGPHRCRCAGGRRLEPTITAERVGMTEAVVGSGLGGNRLRVCADFRLDVGASDSHVTD